MDENQKNAYSEQYTERSDYEKIKTMTDIAMEAAKTTSYKEEQERREQENNDEFTAYMSDSSFGSKVVYAIKHLIRHKEELLIGILFVAVAAMTVYAGYDIVKRFLLLTVTKGITAPVVGLVSSVIPFLLWAWSTKYTLYNFYKVKRLTFRLCVINAVLHMWSILLTVELRLLLPFIFMIPTYGGISYSTVILSAYMFLLGIFATPFVIVMYKFLTITRDEMTDIWIVNFYIKNYLPDTRKNKEFAYDMRCVKKVNSFSKTQTIYQNDRYLHVAGIGSTGTGKTAGIGTVVYESDLQQKVHNTDYQKKVVEKYLEEGKARLTKNFEDIDFNIDYITGVGEDEEEINKELAKLKLTAASAGLTIFCPNAAFADELYQIAKAKRFRVNRVDPMPDERTGELKAEFIGFNPLYVPLDNNQQRYLDKVFTAAKLYADVNQAVFELSGKGDPYFTSLNRSLSVAGSVCVIITYPHVHPGRYATPEDVQDVINNFEHIKPYRDKLVELYGEKNEYGKTNMDIGTARIIPELQFILARIDRDFLGANAPKISEQATGLRNIIDDSLTNTRIRRILCAQETIDLDRVLEKGEITLVNFEISLGSDSTGFGMFFLLSFIQAVLRRGGTADTRIPHFVSIDEAPTLFHPKIETSLTIFRQYRCSMTLFLQSLSQLDKNDTTRYLKQVMIGNCATQIVFGRASFEEMQMFNRLAGRQLEVETSTSIRETALSDENTQMASSTSYAVEETDRYTATDVRYRQFLECTVMTVRDSTPLAPFIGKVNFLPKHKREPVKRYVVDWSKYYNEPEKEEELQATVVATTMVNTPDSPTEIKEPKESRLLSARGVEATTTVSMKQTREVTLPPEPVLPQSVQTTKPFSSAGKGLLAATSSVQETEEEIPNNTTEKEPSYPVLNAIKEIGEEPVETKEEKPEQKPTSDDPIFEFD